MNVFEMLENAITQNITRNRIYGNIGQEISEDEKKNSMGLSFEESQQYDTLKSQDRMRLMGNVRPLTQKDTIKESFNWGADSKPQQIL